MLLQLNDTDRTLGLHSFLHVLRQGADPVFVYPVPKELKSPLKKHTLGKIQLDAMLLEYLEGLLLDSQILCYRAPRNRNVIQATDGEIHLLKELVHNALIYFWNNVNPEWQSFTVKQTFVRVDGYVRSGIIFQLNLLIGM